MTPDRPIAGGVASIAMAQAGVWAVLRRIEANVYGVLLAHANAFTGQVGDPSERETLLSVPTIAHEVGSGEREVQRALKSLADKGVIRLTPGGGRGRLHLIQVETDPVRIGEAVRKARAEFERRSGIRAAAAKHRKPRQQADALPGGVTDVSRGARDSSVTSKPRQPERESPSAGDVNPVRNEPKPRQQADARTQNTVATPEHASPLTPQGGISNQSETVAAAAGICADPQATKFDRLLTERRADTSRERGGRTGKPIAGAVRSVLGQHGVPGQHTPKHNGQARGRLPASEQETTFRLLRGVPGLSEGDARDLARIAPAGAFSAALAIMPTSVRNPGGWLRQAVTEEWATRTGDGVPGERQRQGKEGTA